MYAEMAPNYPASAGRTSYDPVPDGQGLPPLGLIARLDELAPVRHLVGARLGFASRFEKAVRRLSAESGAAMSPHVCALHFGESLNLEIDPQRLTHRLSDQLFDGRATRRTDAHFLDQGDWERVLFPLNETPVHGEILDICRTRAEFRKTSRYRWLVKQIEQGRPMARSGIRLDTVAKLDGYFSYYLDLVESIERFGIVPRRRMRFGQHTGRAHRSTRTLWRDLIERDIGVAVGPDGELVRHTSGRHRLAAAIGLGLERIPVEVRMVHVDWLAAQAKRMGMTPVQALPIALGEIASPAR